MKKIPNLIILLVTLSFFSSAFSQSKDVTFILHTETHTPENETICLHFQEWWKFIPMKKISENEWKVTVDFLNIGETHHYVYCRNYMQAGAEEERENYRVINISQNTITMQDTVIKWLWWPLDGQTPAIDTSNYLFEPPNSLPADSFQCGIELPDFWWSQFKHSVENTLDRIISQTHSNWIQYAPIPAIEQIYPLPIINLNGNNTTSEEDLIRIITESHKRGLKVYLRPFPWPQNVTDDSPNYHSKSWWIEWEKQWRPIMLYYAEICKIYNVEMLSFGLSPNIYYPSERDGSVFDSLSIELYNDVRKIYTNKICIDWDSYSPDLNIFQLGDFLQIRLWCYFQQNSFNDLFNPTLVEIKNLLNERLDNQFKSGNTKYGKSIVLTEISACSFDGFINGEINWEKQLYYEPDNPSIPIDLQEQADAYEAMLQSIAERDWIAGAFSFNYNYWNSIDKAPSVRSKPSEKIINKWWKWILPENVYLTTMASDGGTVEPSIASYILPKDTLVTIYAIPNEGYKFLSWSGDVQQNNEKDNPLNLQMNTDKTIKATFMVVNEYSPEITYFNPKSDTTIYELDSLTFHINAEDKDGNQLSYSWFLNDSLIQIGDNYRWTFETNYESAGNYSVLAKISDGKYEVEHRWEIIVLDNPKKKILFDEVHNEYNSLSWERAFEIENNPQETNKAYFGKFKNEASLFYEIERNTENKLTLELLKNYDILFLSSIRSPLENDEITDIIQFVKNGGNLIVLSQFEQFENLNLLLAPFGISITSGFIFSSENANPFFDITEFNINHPIVSNLSRIHFNYGASIEITNNKAKPIIFSPENCFKDLNNNNQQDANEQSQSYLLMACSEYDSGRVVFYTNNSFADGWNFWNMNGELLLNTLKWFPGNNKDITNISEYKDHCIIPTEYILTQNYPNPFNSKTTIQFHLPKASFVRIKIYNVYGQEIKSLLQQKKQTGVYTITWDGTNNYNSPVSSGIYIIQLSMSDFQKSIKTILLK